MEAINNRIYLDGKEISQVVTKMPVSDLMETVTCEIELTGMRTARARLSIGTRLFKFAAWVTGMKGKITVGNSVLGEMKA